MVELKHPNLLGVFEGLDNDVVVILPLLFVVGYCIDT